MVHRGRRTVRRFRWKARRAPWTVREVDERPIELPGPSEEVDERLVQVDGRSEEAVERSIEVVERSIFSAGSGNQVALGPVQESEGPLRGPKCRCVIFLC
jgi:hypothetical protein